MLRLPASLQLPYSCERSGDLQPQKLSVTSLLSMLRPWRSSRCFSTAPPSKPPPRTPGDAAHSCASHSKHTQAQQHGCAHAQPGEHPALPKPAGKFTHVDGKPVSPYTLSEFAPLPPGWPFNDPNYDPEKPPPEVRAALSRSVLIFVAELVIALFIAFPPLVLLLKLCPSSSLSSAQ